MMVLTATSIGLPPGCGIILSCYIPRERSRDALFISEFLLTCAALHCYHASDGLLACIARSFVFSPRLYLILNACRIIFIADAVSCC